MCTVRNLSYATVTPSAFDRDPLHAGSGVVRL